MFLDYAENITQLLANITALIVCLFQYISRREKGWLYATLFFLSGLMSCYYWTAYLVVMGSTPDVSSFISDTGWNIAFFILLLFVLRMRDEKQRRFFHPLMLLPVPLGLVQLAMYLPFGSVLLNLYQVGILTVISVFCLQGICWHRKNRGADVRPPYIERAILLFILCEFGMWISSWLEPPYPAPLSSLDFLDLGSLYYPFSFAGSFSYLCIVRALFRTYRSGQENRTRGLEAKFQRLFKAGYFVVLVVCFIGGILLASWMRDTVVAGLESDAESEIYSIIPVILFIITLFQNAFAVIILFIVFFSEKVAENNELREARKIAEQASAAKSDFLANMSHEIRTPINAVLGMNEMILRESLQARDLLPKERETIRRIFADICTCSGNIDSAGKNLLALINDILDFSKIEAGKLDIVNADYKLSSVLNDVSNMIAFRARDKGLDFRVEVDGSLPDGLYGDEFRVRQILTNVLSNAVKYTKAGSVVLTVEAEDPEAVREGSFVRLVVAVKDTGIGIRPEDIGRLFQKFERVDMQSNSTVEGTGLGLAITHSLLDMMGGSIAVESVYGKGSTFTVVLPQQVVSAEPVGDFREKFEKSLLEAKAYHESFRAPDAHILIVDDTRMNLTVAVSLLKKTDMEIDTVTSGAEAVALARTIRYDLILMDQRMPEMDGTEAMRRIRAQADGANGATPFICLTADAVSGARERYLAEGFTDYLTKPIDSRALEQMLIRHLPAEKVLLQTAPSAEEEPAAEEAGAFDALRGAGIDPAEGLGRCQGDADMYRTLLLEYARGAEEKSAELQKLLDAEDWAGYAILAHALKSTSRTIGASALSELAAAQESAADAGQADAVRSAHAQLLAGCAAACGAIRALLGPTDGQAAGADDEILEFLPGEP